MERNQRSLDRLLIASVVDGYVLLPILTALDDRGVITRLLSHDGVSFHGEKLTDSLRAAIFLLESKRLVSHERERFIATDLGRSVFARLGAYRTVLSYDPYLRNLPDLLFDPGKEVHVDRAVNVRGAGAMNLKYFKLVSAHYRESKAKYLLDIGCGDGTNLQFALSCNPRLTPIGVDFEEPSLMATQQRLSSLSLNSPPLFFQGSVKEPEVILEKLVENGIDPAEVLTSVWFIFHEVLGDRDLSLSDLLFRYKPLCQQGLIVGEIFPLDAQYLAEYGQGSGAATFLFLHYLSGQRPVSKALWERAILEAEMRVKEFVPAEMMGAECRTGVWVLSLH